MFVSTVAGTPVKYEDTPLRQAQRELTRQRIRDAGRDLFYAEGYETATMDQIANLAGLRRSTLYLHYRDKAEILVDIIADYTPRALAEMERLPGPMPSVEQILVWLRGLIEFFRVEKAPIAIFQDIGATTRGLPQFKQLLEDILAGLGRNVPAFRAAADNMHFDPLARARGTMIVNQITAACTYASRNEPSDYTEALFLVVSEAIHAYTRSDDGVAKPD